MLQGFGNPVKLAQMEAFCEMEPDVDGKFPLIRPFVVWVLGTEGLQPYLPIVHLRLAEQEWFAIAFLLTVDTGVQLRCRKSIRIL